MSRGVGTDQALIRANDPLYEMGAGLGWFTKWKTSTGIRIKEPGNTLEAQGSVEQNNVLVDRASSGIKAGTSATTLLFTRASTWR